ncbi:hypothetical protein OIU78_025215 [Salix suchowensis]|nr:hypothetical protein OIU78_025215 [Salix suchowensis]
MNGVGENAGITVQTPFGLKNHEKYSREKNNINFTQNKSSLSFFFIYFIRNINLSRNFIILRPTWSIINEV